MLSYYSTVGGVIVIVKGRDSMKFVLRVIVAGLMFTAASVNAQDGDKVAKAEAAALAWLTLTDAGDYPRSWDQAAGYFQASISKPNWTNAVGKIRQPLGRLISRRVKSAKFTRSLPGAPDGEYVVIQYDTQFEHKDGAIETVTPLLEKDDSWKVSGYFIR
jgi:hypothetical protein